MAVTDLFKTDDKGNITEISLKNTQIPMRSDEYAQAIVFEDESGAYEVKFERAGDRYVGNYGGICFEKTVAISNGQLINEIFVKTGDTVPEYKYIDLRSGIDSYMEKYPEWNKQFFPTFLRCEKTHFWGYFSRTDGKKLAVVCKDKLASWRNYYNRVYYDPENPDDPGHRVYTTSFCLFCSLKQPKRHPETHLEPNQTYRFRFIWQICDSFEELNEFYDYSLGIQLVKAKKWTLEKGEKISFEKEDGDYVLTNEKGDIIDIDKPLDYCGRFYLKHTRGTRQSESIFYVREDTMVYLRTAALAAMKREQFASTNCETYYGFSAIFAYLCEADDKELLEKAQDKLEEFLNTILTEDYDLKKEAAPGRVQNYTTVISILNLAYHATRNEKYLDIAVKLAHKFMLCQKEDGAYYNARGVHYTCVIYPAKSLFELSFTLKELGKEYADIYSSAMRACENLLVLKTDIGTEGEHTFEDGMISTESLQLALAGILSEGRKREEYTAVAKEVLDEHRCVELEYAPDARYRGATLRHWEAHYDILCSRNMMLSPHGWTSWKIYAQYYLYELTNDPAYLVDYFDTLGACLQCAEVDKEDVNWAFVLDPCVEADLFVPCKDGGTLKKEVLGEEYLPCISTWWRADPSIISVGYGDPRFGYVDGRARGACCDNDVFEHFKCLWEVGMHAVLHEEADGWIAYNCRISDNEVSVPDKSMKKIRIYLSEDKNLFVNGKEYALNKGVNYITVNKE